MTSKEKAIIEQVIRLIAEYGIEAREFIVEAVTTGEIEESHFEEAAAQLEEAEDYIRESKA